MLGHELRNPLTPIVTALEILRRRGRNDDELELIDRQVSHLRRLVDDLLDVSRITRGKVELHTEHIELSVDRRAGRRSGAPAVPAKATAPDGRHRRARARRRRRSIAARAGVRQPAHQRREVQRRGHRGVSRRRSGAAIASSSQVRDQGEGIEPEMLDRVFDLFVQRGQPADRAQSGLGLGLTIVRNLITLHGGTVRAKSEGRGRGTVVVVDLPIAHELTMPSRAASRRAPPGAHFAPARRATFSSSTTMRMCERVSADSSACTAIKRRRRRRTVGAEDRRGTSAARRARRHRSAGNGRLRVRSAAAAHAADRTSTRRDHRLRPAVGPRAVARRGLRRASRQAGRHRHAAAAARVDRVAETPRGQL